VKARFEKLLLGTSAWPLQYEFWPADNEESKKVVIVLHGRGDHFESYHWLPETLGIPDFNYLFLNAPDSWGGGYSWYDLAPKQAPGVVRSRRLLMEIVGSLQKDFGLNASDIFLFGFSQGCLLSLDMALRYPRAFGGIVGLSGYVFFMEEYPQALAPAAMHQRIFMTHGHQDEVLPLNVTRVSVNALRSYGVNIDWREYDKAHTIDVVQEIPEVAAFLKHILDLS